MLLSFGPDVVYGMGDRGKVSFLNLFFKNRIGIFTNFGDAINVCNITMTIMHIQISKNVNSFKNLEINF